MATQDKETEAPGVIDFHIPSINQSIWLVALASIFVTAAIFMLIPFTQLLESVGKKDSVIVAVDIAPPPPPPPPDIPDEEEEESDDTPPPPPPPPPPPQLSLAQLDLAMDPGIGDAMAGAFGFGDFDTKPDAMAELKDFFSVNELDEKPRMINFVAPEKPYDMRKDRIAGYTRVRFQIDENGDMLRIVHFTDTTHKVLEDAVRAVFKQWKMTEPKKNGQRVKAVVEIPFKF